MLYFQGVFLDRDCIELPGTAVTSSGELTLHINVRNILQVTGHYDTKICVSKEYL